MAEGTQPADANIPSAPCRETYWEEKTADEKIIVLGQAVEALAKELSALATAVGQLRYHLHAGDGRVVAPLDVPQHLDLAWWMKNILGMRAP